MPGRYALIAPLRADVRRLTVSVPLCETAVGVRHRTRQIEVDGLSIMHSRPQGEQLLDFWQGPNVFSVAWDGTGSLTVVAFSSGGLRTRFVSRDG